MSTDLKKHRFSLNLGKSMEFRNKILHKHYIYENCKKYFRSGTRILKE